MRSILFLLIAIIHIAPLKAQLQPYNKAIVWRGFQHSWTYNHRCNRIGDYVVFNNGSPYSVHTSATGLGPDSTYFTSHYTYIESDDLVFTEGKESIHIETKEKQLSEGFATVELIPQEWMKNRSDYISLFNGFDLKSDAGSDKIQLLRLSIEDPEYNSDSSKLVFKINYSFVFNCQSVECSGRNVVSYSLDIYYLIIGLNEFSTKATEKFFPRSYSWDKKEEVVDRPEEKVMNGISFPVFNKATVGIKAFSVVLNEAHWLLQLNNNVTPLEYNPATGKMRISLDLLYKEWQEGMRGSNAAPQPSQFAAKRKGWVLLDSDILLLQLRAAEIRHLGRNGRMFWKGYNRNPNGNDALNVSPIPLD
jgi:hypothetical protein